LQRAFRGNFERHRKLARITWPLWFYVAVSGVVVYLMVSKYY
jgi:putative membrane protein